MDTLRMAYSGEDRNSLTSLTEFLSRETGISIVPCPLASYPAIRETLSSGYCALGWLPPIVAFDLLSCGAAHPLVAATREQGEMYFACLVASEKSAIWNVDQLRGKRAGWVSVLSAAGYIIPRLHLRSLGVSLTDLFASEQMFGSHQAVCQALGRECDVIATYLDTSLGPSNLHVAVKEPHRILQASGPIPSDVVAAGASLPQDIRDQIYRALLRFTPEPHSTLARVTHLKKFSPLGKRHWHQLQSWQESARGIFTEDIGQVPHERPTTRDFSC